MCKQVKIFPFNSKRPDTRYHSSQKSIEGIHIVNSDRFLGMRIAQLLQWFLDRYIRARQYLARKNISDPRQSIFFFLSISNVTRKTISQLAESYHLFVLNSFIRFSQHDSSHCSSLLQWAGSWHTTKLFRNEMLKLEKDEENDV